MTEDRLDKLEARVAELESFKAQIVAEALRKELDSAFTILESNHALMLLEKEIQGQKPGLYCAKCRTRVNASATWGIHYDNAECPECKAKTHVDIKLADWHNSFDAH